MSAIHSLLEVDVTGARNRVREYRKKTGESLSFTAFLTFCLARAVDENKIVHAYRRGSKLIIFDQVDISVVIEREISDEKAPVFPHVIKAANQKTLIEIHCPGLTGTIICQDSLEAFYGGGGSAPRPGVSD